MNKGYIGKMLPGEEEQGPAIKKGYKAKKSVKHSKKRK